MMGRPGGQLATHRSERATEIQAPWLIRRIQTHRCRHRKKDTQHKDLSSAPTTGALCGTLPTPLLSLLVGFPLFLSSPSINFRFSFSIYIYIYIYIFEHDQHTASHRSLCSFSPPPSPLPSSLPTCRIIIYKLKGLKKPRKIVGRPTKREYFSLLWKQSCGSCFLITWESYRREESSRSVNQ
jgi:hypothetical protein